jgi:hypothetical protein
MSSPYLVIDRSGNAVDINSTEPPTCHDQLDSVALETDFNPFKSCNGCPSTRRHPGCHDTCLGKAFRDAKDEIKRRRTEAARLDDNASIVAGHDGSRVEYDKLNKLIRIDWDVTRNMDDQVWVFD